MRSTTAASSSAEHRPLPRWFIATMLLLVLSRGVVWSIATPIWQVPDETDHVSYAERLRWDPDLLVGQVFYSAALNESLETSQKGPVHPTALDADELRAARDRLESIDLDDGARQSTFGVSAAGYPPFFYLLGAVAYRAVDAAGGSYLATIQALRLLGALIATGAFGLQMLLAGRLLRDRFRTVAASIIMAALPMVGFSSTTLNPDVLMSVWFAAALLVALRLQRRGWSWRTYAGLVAIVAAAFLTKPTAVILLPLVLLVAVTAHRTGARLSKRLRLGAVVAGLVAAVAPIRLFTMLDAPVGTTTELAAQGRASLGIDSISRYAGEFQDSFLFLYNTSFWASFGWLDAKFVDMRIYSWLLAFAIVGIAGASWRTVRARRVPLRWLLAIVPLVTLVVVIMGIEFTLVTTDRGLFIQGRYLFPMLPVIISAFLVGITSLQRWPWLGRGVVLGAVGVVVLLEVESWVMLVLPRFSL